MINSTSGGMLLQERGRGQSRSLHQEFPVRRSAASPKAAALRRGESLGGAAEVFPSKP